ncbi:lipopolysaccharide kinase InaA family protein [Pseudomonas sp. dw_358]|uniref:lipopolysaccharide kinase InaA family protein n=1 Tax=Pseudomonas sp. dw_358 TaxID=2720083 RepID=UPI001BD2197E|nr:lipopolysaccharide kinase InaA family protein [Pseudomonas sp. dw_358]
MSDFIAEADRALLHPKGLDQFDTLWALPLEAVDEPNTGRGGWSSVFRLDVDGQGYYLKRQSNYLTRSLARPLGEPTFAREFRNIDRYRKLAIPALQAAYYGQRQVDGELRAMLMTRALDGWTDLDTLLGQWSLLGEVRRHAVLRACGELARTLHDAGQVHGCFYPKHIFLRASGEQYLAQLIDLEKTRALLFGQQDRVRDLEPLLRRATAWSVADTRVFLATYLHCALDSPQLDAWGSRLGRRRSRKEAR